MSILPSFLILLGALVFVHELAHFLAAKYFGVGVEAFSLGFGPRLLGKKYKDTDYRISLIPLGGYVKMVGEDIMSDVAPADMARSFAHKPAYQRLIIALAGPLGNFFFSFLIYSTIFAIGIENTLPMIGYVKPNTPAASAGLQPGDRVVEIDGKKIEWWEDLEKIISTSAGHKLNMTIKRDQARLTKTITPEEQLVKNAFNEEAKSGLIGIRNAAFSNYIGITDMTSPAYLAGLRSGDQIEKIDAQPIKYFYEIEKLVAANPEKELTFTVKRESYFKEEDPKTGQLIKTGPDKPAIITLKLTPQKKMSRAADGTEQASGWLGLETFELYIAAVSKDLPAAKAGIKPGDKIVAINSQAVATYNDFDTILQKSANTQLTLDIIRDGNRQQISLTPVMHAAKEGPFKKKVEKPRAGVLLYDLYTPQTGLERYNNPMRILASGIRQTVYFSGYMVLVVAKLFSGKIPLADLGGPILIADMSGQAAEKGLIDYLFLMAGIGINLFIINLLPILPLDGGHILFCSMEIVRRRPVSLKMREFAFKVGFFFIMGLIGLTFWNDFYRYCGEWLGGVIQHLF
jgi:regulator of sigma E protease